MESVLGNIPMELETPPIAKSLACVIKEQARLDEKRPLHLLKHDGETEFTGVYRIFVLRVS